MVAKITSGMSVYGALYYNQEKVEKGKAQTLGWNRIMERPDGTAGIPECMRSFEPYLAMNRRTEKPVIHLSLNPHPDDRLSDEQLETIGREYMEKLGYGDQPYIIFRHEDNARPHIHIVSLRVDEQGRKIRDYKEWERSMKICRELEQKYPYYAFEKNAGYGTKAHIDGLKRHGVTPEHRKSYRPIQEFLHSA